MTPPERGGSTIRAVDEVSIRKSRPGKMLLRFSENHLIALASSATILRGFMHSFDAQNPWKLHHGELYVAYATGTDSSATWAYVEDGVHSFPVACPATLFDVLDPRPSSVWIANTHLQYTVQAAPEWALDPYDYYDRLTDGEPRAREQYEERKRFMDLEFARPDVTSVATPVGDDEAMCDHCSHVWTPPSAGQLIRCPRCQYLQNRPPTYG